MYFKIPFFGYIGQWHLLLTALIAIILYYAEFAAGYSGLEIILYLVIAFALSFPVFNALKRVFFRRIIAFDMGGVFASGNFKFERLRPVPEVVVLIKKLRTNYNTALLSNQYPDMYDSLRKKFHFDSLFDYQVIPMHARAEKPDARIYQTFLNKTGRSAGDVIFIDDLEANIAAARRIGMKGIVFKSLPQLKEALKAQGIDV